ncbi:MAG: DUF3180 domain-containing protein [Nakamurella sp.]
MADTHGSGIGPTRARDLLVVFVVAAVIVYALTRFNYSALPRLPRFAGLSAALLGAGEMVAGWGLRRRIQVRRQYLLGDGFGARAVSQDRRPVPRPVPPLVAARALAVAKASALAGAAFSGLWFGFGAYVLPNAAAATAPAADSVTAVVGLVGAGVLIAGALWLEYCCRAPDDGLDGRR